MSGFLDEVELSAQHAARAAAALVPARTRRRLRVIGRELDGLLLDLVPAPTTKPAPDSGSRARRINIEE